MLDLDAVTLLYNISDNAHMKNTKMNQLPQILIFSGVALYIFVDSGLITKVSKYFSLEVVLNEENTADKIKKLELEQITEQSKKIKQELSSLETTVQSQKRNLFELIEESTELEKNILQKKEEFARLQKNYFRLSSIVIDRLVVPQKPEPMQSNMNSKNETDQIVTEPSTTKLDINNNKDFLIFDPKLYYNKDSDQGLLNFVSLEVRSHG
jgi:septal ring factor EnvC (AmiA/AmiB activator)